MIIIIFIIINIGHIPTSFCFVYLWKNMQKHTLAPCARPSHR